MPEIMFWRLYFTQNITWELVRNIGSQSPPDPLESVLISRWFKYNLKNQLAFYFFWKNRDTGIAALFFKKIILKQYTLKYIPIKMICLGYASK